jgi:4-coumarate--CoA ligase
LVYNFLQGEEDKLLTVPDSEHCASVDETVLHIDAADPENKLTKSGLREKAQKIAHGLRHKYGIGASGPNKDVITVMSYGQVMVPAMFYGTIIAGGVYSAASPSSTVSELARQISTGNSNLVVCNTELKDIAIAAARQCKIPLDRVLLLESSPSWTLSSIGTNASIISDYLLPWQRITDEKALKDSLIVILWSSGTTGLPKGVMLSNLNLVAESYITALAGREWGAKEIEAGRALGEYRTLAHLPISHIAGVFGYLLAPMYSGGTVCWMRKYEWHTMLKYVKELKITAFYTVPSIYLRIAKSPDVTDQFKTVINATTGAAPMDADLQRSANSRLGDGAQTFIGQTWGLSETTGAVTMMPRGYSDVTGSISPILPSVELRMVDDNYHDVEPGQQGEMLIRSPLVTNGYYNNPQATKEAFHGDWFCTGDIGIMRDGKFYIVDRKKELLKYKGLQIAPAEIENLLFTHPKIKEAAVVGVRFPEDPGSDCPRAYVVADPQEVSEEEIKDFVKGRLAQYKQLRGGVVFVEELPKNAVGKYLRRELRDRANVELGLNKKAAKL